MTTNPSNSHVFSDEQLIAMAKELGIDIPKEPMPDNRIKISVEQFRALPKLGAGFVKKGHAIWQVEKEGDEYFLKRMQEESA